MKEILEQLKRIKEEKNISYPEIAKMIGIKGCTLSKWMYSGSNPCGKNKALLMAFINNSTKENEIFTEESIAEEQKETVVVTKKQYDKKFEVVKLETVEDIVDALLNGETLNCDNYKIRMEKGVIVKYSALMKPLFINPALSFDDVYTTVRKKMLCLAVGKRYKDEDENVWFIYRNEEGESGNSWFNGVMEGTGDISDFRKTGESLFPETRNLTEEL